MHQGAKSVVEGATRGRVRRGNELYAYVMRGRGEPPWHRYTPHTTIIGSQIIRKNISGIIK